VSSPYDHVILLFVVIGPKPFLQMLLLQWEQWSCWHYSM